MDELLETTMLLLYTVGSEMKSNLEEKDNKITEALLRLAILLVKRGGCSLTSILDKLNLWVQEANINSESSFPYMGG